MSFLARRAPVAEQRHQRRQHAVHLGEGHVVVGVGSQAVQRARRTLLAHVGEAEDWTLEVGKECSR